MVNRYMWVTRNKIPVTHESYFTKKKSIPNETTFTYPMPYVFHDPDTLRFPV